MALLKWLITTSILLTSGFAFAVKEETLRGEGAVQIQQFLIANLKWHSFQAFDGKKISYATLFVPGSKATVIVSPGRSESIISQSEIIFDLAKAGFSVAAIDHRGQGYSERLTITDAGHVGNFRDYTKDFARFVSQADVKSLPRPQHIFASSMGAAIASDCAIINPGRFKSVVLAAPFFELNTNWIGNTIVRAVANAAQISGYGEAYAPTMKPYNFDQTFDGKALTSSEVRFTRDVQLTRRNPTTAVGGPTVNWVREAVLATRDLRSRAKLFKDPLLILQSGNDRIVRNAAQNQFCAEAVNCKLRSIPGASHWLLMESDKYRNSVFASAFLFFKNNQ